MYFSFLKSSIKKKQHLEILQQAPTCHFVSIYFFLSQTLRVQQFRDQTLQLLSELWGHVWHNKYVKAALSVCGIWPNAELKVHGKQSYL